jgi:transcriptional regulator with XRE-family HTH domain
MFGTMIRKARVAKGLSMEQLARMVGVTSFHVVYRWEKGRRHPEPLRIPLIAKALDLDEEQLRQAVIQSKAATDRRADRSAAGRTRRLAAAEAMPTTVTRAEITDIHNRLNRLEEMLENVVKRLDKTLP